MGDGEKTSKEGVVVECDKVGLQGYRLWRAEGQAARGNHTSLCHQEVIGPTEFTNQQRMKHLSQKINSKQQEHGPQLKRNCWVSLLHVM